MKCVFNDKIFFDNYLIHQIFLCQVGKGEDSLTITNLAPFTVYGVTVLALNKEGESSLPSAGVKVVTHVDGDTAHVSNTNRWRYLTISCNNI